MSSCPAAGARVSNTRTPVSGLALFFVPLRDRRERFAQIALEIAVQAVHVEQALQRVGLEYFGIDCGLDRAGNLVVFEVNASMLVHARNEDFPYKAPFVLRIKQAFDAMLQKLATSSTS